MIAYVGASHARLAAAISICLVVACGPATADIEALTLYQKTARATLIARVRALTDSTRRPPMEVLEIFKGSYTPGRLTVVPHFEDHAQPTPWLKREVFRRGEESILFLLPYVDEYGRGEGPEIFSLLNADQGKLMIPAEGGDALVSALRTMIEIQAMSPPDRQEQALRALLSDANPHLVEAAIEECLRFRLAEDADIETLLGLLAHRRPGVRAGAAGLLAQVVRDARAAQRELPDRPRLAEKISAAARLDADEAVRAQTVGALEALGDSSALALLEAIAKEDSSQKVRYMAAVAAHGLKSERGSD